MTKKELKIKILIETLQKYSNKKVMLKETIISKLQLLNILKQDGNFYFIDGSDSSNINSILEVQIYRKPADIKSVKYYDADSATVLANGGPYISFELAKKPILEEIIFQIKEKADNVEELKAAYKKLKNQTEEQYASEHPNNFSNN